MPGPSPGMTEGVAVTLAVRLQGCPRRSPRMNPRRGRLPAMARPDMSANPLIPGAADDTAAALGQWLLHLSPAGRGRPKAG